MIEELHYGVYKDLGSTDEVLARCSKFELAKAAFEKALFLFPADHIQMRQGTRIILKSKEN